MNTILPTVARIARRSARGFTVIELLVVIAIIAILATLLLPALGRPKQQPDAPAALAKAGTPYLPGTASS